MKDIHIRMILIAKINKRKKIQIQPGDHTAISITLVNVPSFVSLIVLFFILLLFSPNLTCFIFWCHYIFLNIIKLTAFQNRMEFVFKVIFITHAIYSPVSFYQYQYMHDCTQCNTIAMKCSGKQILIEQTLFPHSHAIINC